MITSDVVDGKVITETTPTYAKSGGDNLDKQAFLQLLVAQMQNQDPLEPTDNTEYVSQLAQFSALEAMTNVNQTITNQNAFSLVGKNVIIAAGSSEGEVSTEVAGVVDYIKMIDGEAYLYVNEKEYSIKDLEYVVDDNYIK